MVGHTNPLVVIAGHSHRGVYARAIDQRISEARAAVVMQEQGPREPDSSYWDMALEAATGRAMAVIWRGNQHNNRFLFAGTKTFKLAGMEGASQIVPESMVQAVWSLDGMGSILERAGKVASRVFLLGTPPPKSEAKIREGLAREEALTVKVREMGWEAANVPLTSEAVRARLWRILQRQMADAGRDAGVPFVPVPAEAVDERGVLRDEYSGDDATHANAQYGALALEVLLRTMEAPA